MIKTRLCTNIAKVRKMFFSKFNTDIHSIVVVKMTIVFSNPSGSIIVATPNVAWFKEVNKIQLKATNIILRMSTMFHAL